MKLVFMPRNLLVKHNTSIDKLERFTGIPISLIDELIDISEKKFDFSFDSENLDIRID